MMLSVRPRLTMCSRVFMFLIGAAYIYHQVVAAEDVFIAELMVESNVTLEAHTVLSVLNTTTDLTVTIDGKTHRVTLEENGLVAECLIIGDATSCNCSRGYIWSNEVCYNHGCCRETTCKKNVSHVIPLCVSKSRVYINGTVTLPSGLWDSTKTSQLLTVFEKLNGFESLNVTGQRLDDTVVEFEAGVSVKFETSKLQELVTELEGLVSGVALVASTGMVTIESPQTTVCYESTPILKCTFEEVTDKAGWNMSNMFQHFELNTGSVVELNHDCTTDDFKSCVIVKLHKVTEIWSGSYECSFTRGSVVHTAKAPLRVAQLPDVINLKIDPITADCSTKAETDSVNVQVTATIMNSTDSFDVWWSYKGDQIAKLYNKSEGDFLVYSFIAPISCKRITEAQRISVTFINSKDQKKSASVDIPVIYEGENFCSEEVINGDFWPKTPDGDTAINRTCGEGRVGYKSRTCEGKNWQLVFNYCVNRELNKVANAADNFLKGLGATQKVARDIFEGLKNSSLSDSDPGDSMADISASINVLNVMASASRNVALQEDVLPDLADAASNMLNNTWEGVNKSVVEEMSSTYLESVESLVENIRVNNSKNYTKPNLDMKFCSGRDCDVSVFDIGVNLNKTDGLLKTVAVKSLTDKLKNNYDKKEPSSLLISVTLQNSNDSTFIRLDFPKDRPNVSKPVCVFWNTTDKEWSNAGCKVKTNDGNDTTCECEHLTSFAVLFAKDGESNIILDIISNVGMGVSICSLLIFLVIESLVWSAVVKSNLSHFRHTALVNIAVFLLLADCSMLASDPTMLGETGCLALTVCKHLFFLAMFSWMLCMSVMLVHQLIFVFSPLRKRVFMFLSSIVGYICPILIVGSSYVYCRYTNKPYYDKDTCWLVYEKLLEGSMHAFILPIGTVVMTNLFSMVVVILTLTKTSVPDGGKADDKDTAKSILKVVVFLTPVFGVTWIFGFAQLILEKDTPMHTIAIYTFTILNSFQGLLILITGCIAEQKVRDELLKLIMAKSGKGKSESMKNLTSTSYTKDK